MFPLAPPNAAHDKFNSLLNALRDSLDLRPAAMSNKHKDAADNHDTSKLQELVDILRSELGASGEPLLHNY